MFINTRGKMPDRFANVTGITARICNFINHTWTEPAKDKVFHTKHVTDLKEEKN